MIKKLKLSVWVLFAVLATTLTSCLGDSENTQYISGVGTVASSNSIMLDNGLYVQLTDLSSSLTLGDRIYIYGTADGDAYQAAVAKLQAGERATLTLQSLYQGGIFETCEEFLSNPDNYEDNLDDCLSSAVSGLSWNGYGSFGNGYLNFNVSGDYYLDKSKKLVPVEFTLLAKTVDPANKKIELVLVYDNAESQCVGTDGKVLDGYSKVTGNTIPVSCDLSSLYYTLSAAGVADTDEISLSVAYVTKSAESGATKEVCADGDALNGMYGGKNYFTLSILKRQYRLY